MEKAVENIARKAAKLSKPVEGDYTGEDGLLYCGKCRTPKQCYVSFGGGRRKMPRACQCHEDARKVKEAEERAAQVRKLQKAGGVSPSFLFDRAQGSRTLNACRRYAARWDEMEKKNIGLLLWGGVGTGKTFAAHCVCNELISRPEPVAACITSLSRVLNTGYDKTEVIQRIQRTPLVVFDDLGAERSSEYALETVFLLVDERYRTRRPLIVTTNLTLDELKNPHDIDRKRIYDRVLEMCVPLFFEGVSRRDVEAAEKLRVLRELMEEEAAPGAANTRNGKAERT